MTNVAKGLLKVKYQRALKLKGIKGELHAKTEENVKFSKKKKKI